MEPSEGAASVSSKLKSTLQRRPVRGGGQKECKMEGHPGGQCKLSRRQNLLWKDCQREHEGKWQMKDISTPDDVIDDNTMMGMSQIP